MRGVLFRCAITALTALTAGCGGTSRVGDELTTTSLAQSRKAVALMKLGAFDPMCTVLQAGVGVREGESYRIVQTARIRRSASQALVAELELGTGEYHVVSFICNRPRGGTSQLAQPLGGGLFKKSYASFSLAPGEIINVGYLQLVPMASTQVAFGRVVSVRLVVTDWPLTELERFKLQRPGLYGQMKTRLMTVPKVEPPSMQQIQARCDEMRRLRAEGKLQNLPPICNPPGGTPPARRPGKMPGRGKEIGA